MTDGLEVGWMPGPTERGTLTLVWSCLITIFACTWTVLHLNVPGPNDTALTITLRKAKWMAINILFPEFVFSKAICDLRLALQELQGLDKEMQRTRKKINWTTQYGGLEIQWTWKIRYPGRWSGLLYALLRLERPPNLARGCCLSRRFLRRLFYGTPSAPADAESTGSELESRHRFTTACEDYQRTAAEQQHPESIHETSSLRAFNELDRYFEMRTDRGISEPAGSPTGWVDAGSPNARSPGQISTSQTTKIVRRKLEWTVVHSYYAQMGGLIHPATPEGRVYTITASHLTWRFIWAEWVTNHPLRHLTLEKDDILDKSKADWLLKSLAILQVAWIMINVIVRHITQLPISQLELATVAFSVMAILVYLANWWKPKDISRPTILQFYGSGHARGNDRKQSFTQRIWSPTSAIQKAGKGVRISVERVENDNVWLEGDIPLLFYLMAGSSLIFGSVHCLAWNFEFPTGVELICWRVASLASAVLPVLALVITSLGHLVVHYFWDHYFATKLSEKLRFRQLMTKPIFLNWGIEEQIALLTMPRELRDWEVRPTPDFIEQRAPQYTTAFRDRVWANMTILRRTMVGSRSWALLITHRREWRLLVSSAKKCNSMLEENPDILEFWRDYEEFLGTKYPQLNRALDSGPITPSTYLQETLNVVEQVSTQAIAFKGWVERVTNLISIMNFIIYIAARLVILVLLFASLRAAPAGLYHDTAWSHFLPKIS